MRSVDLGVQFAFVVTLLHVFQAVHLGDLAGLAGCAEGPKDIKDSVTQAGAGSDLGTIQVHVGFHDK